jgi:hypothetical protein
VEKRRASEYNKNQDSRRGDSARSGGDSNLTEEELVKAIDDADFELLMGEEKIYEFLNFVKESVDNEDNSVVVRVACECDEGEALFPFYVWAVYSVSVDGDYVGLAFKQFMIPREDEPTSYYSVPKALEGRKFFSVVIE